MHLSKLKSIVLSLDPSALGWKQNPKERVFWVVSPVPRYLFFDGYLSLLGSVYPRKFSAGCLFSVLTLECCMRGLGEHLPRCPLIRFMDPQGVLVPRGPRVRGICSGLLWTLISPRSQSDCHLLLLEVKLPL